MLPLDRFRLFIEQNRLFNHQSKILAAVSGGMDSVLMATLLHAGGYQIAVAHCNFGLRGDEALRDEEFCRQLAHTLDVPFYSTQFDTKAYSVDHKLSVQMAARELRYQWFEQTRQQIGFDLIALAHHQNDTVETILLNLTRGTGIAGLHGIRPKNGKLVRPLLFLTREEIETAVSQNNLSFVEDSSNASVKYARNKIRHEVVPKLKELNPNLEQTFADHIKHFSELEELFNLKLDEIKHDLFAYCKDEIHLTITAVKQLKPVHLLLYGVLKPFGFNSTTVADLITSLDKHAGRRFDGEGWVLVVDRDVLILSKTKPCALQSVIITEEDSIVNIGDKQIHISTAETPYEFSGSTNIAAVDAALLVYPLQVRGWQQGDQFYPLGMKTRKKLSDFFIGIKVPLHQKTAIPVLVNGNGSIIWIAGYRLDNRFKITPGTKKIAIFELTE